MLAFDAVGGAVLAWVAVGQTQAQEVTPPQGVTHDRDAFAFGGKTLVVRDRFSGSLYLYDTTADQTTEIPSASINMGGGGGPNLWEVDGDLIATANSTVTTADGAHKRIKMIDISDPAAPVVTPFDVDPGETPSGINIDTAGGRIVVRGNNTFYVYTIATPAAAPEEFVHGPLQGGGGSSDIVIDGLYVAFFDDNDDFTLLNVNTGVFTQPTRNPGRETRGLAFESSRLAYFAMQTADDGGTVSQMNRCLVGRPNTIDSLHDPSGAFVNGQDENDGRLGFGATVAISPNGRFVFVAGETGVGVDEVERLYLSADGGFFQGVEDTSDALDVRRAAGVAASDNVVAFLIPDDPTNLVSSDVSIGYAPLPPP